MSWPIGQWATPAAQSDRLRSAGRIRQLKRRPGSALRPHWVGFQPVAPIILTSRSPETETVASFLTTDTFERATPDFLISSARETAQYRIRSLRISVLPAPIDRSSAFVLLGYCSMLKIVLCSGDSSSNRISFILSKRMRDRRRTA